MVPRAVPPRKVIAQPRRRSPQEPDAKCRPHIAAAPTFGDAQAVVLWTSGVTMDIRVDTGGFKSMVRGGTGEVFQMAFGGRGYVLVQPSESVVQGGTQASGNKSSGGGLGSFLGG